MPRNMGLDRHAPARPSADGSPLVLVALDDSEPSFRAAAYAAGIARRQGCRLLAAHVVPRYIPWTEWMPDGGSDARGATEQVAREIRAQADDAAAVVGVPVDFRELHGDPYTELVRLADEQRADTVVVGASTSAEHRLLGSLAVRLVRHGRWPVTVVP